MSARTWLRAAGVALCVTASLLAGCGGGGASLVPHATGGGGSQQGNLAEGTLRIIIPQKTTNGKKRPAYVSPSTTYLAWTLDGTPQTPPINLTPSDPRCTGSPLSCTINFYVAPGPHTFSFTLEDASYVALSAATNLNFTLQTGIANTLPVTLGGIANSFSVSSSNTNFATPASGSNQYTVYGTKAVTLTINALDADNNIIVGTDPGALGITATLSPQPSASPVPATLTAGSSNTWTLTSSYAPTNPALSGVGALVVSASPYPGSGVTATVTGTYNLQFYVPWLYVAQSGSGTVTTYDEQGNQQSVTISGLKSPSAVYFGAYSSGATPLPSPNTPTPAPSPYLYVGQVTTITPTPVPTAADTLGPNTYTGSIGTYNGDSTTPTITGSFAGVGVPAGLTFDTNLNYVYVLNSIGTALQAYDAQGNATSVITSAPTISNPSGIAFDPANDALYVSTSSGVFAYQENGSALAVSSFGSVSTPTGIAYDSHLNEIAVLNKGNSTITLYAPSGGSPVAGPFSVISSPTAIAFDPYTQWFYVANATSIAAYSESGSLQTLSGGWPGLSTPTSITVVQ